MVLENVEELEERVMGTLTSKVPGLLRERGWAAMDLFRKGMSYNMAYRAARGETNLSCQTLVQLCDILEVDKLDDIISYNKNGAVGDA